MRRRRLERLRFERLESRRLLAVFTVNSTLDAVDTDPGDGVCESDGGICTLRAAIQEANAFGNVGGPDEVDVPAGTYTLSLAGIDEQQSRTGDLDITGNLIIRGSGDVIIDAGGIDRVIDIIIGAVEISGLTIRGGTVEDDDFFEGAGGGIRNQDILTINDSVISGNIAAVGAGIANYNGTLKISRSVISGNGNGTTTLGGGISNYSNYDPADLEITETTISGNQAVTGGGINNRSYDGMATATISRSTISGNTASLGAGISNQSTIYYDEPLALLTIRNSTVAGNDATSTGGGIRNEADSGGNSVLDIANSTVSGNTSFSDGGGIMNVASDGATLTINSTIISGNTAGGQGNDLYSDNTSANFSLVQDPAGHTLTDGVSNNLVGADPLLGPLGDNGGFTLTHTLLDGSPAIDKGSNSAGLSSDQRGSAFSRTVDDAMIGNADDGTDIGAIEAGQSAAVQDFGDAPDGIDVSGILRNYPTLGANNGARHASIEGGPHLGSLAGDAEPDAIPTASADGDDLAGIDDEDSLTPDTFVLTPGQPISGSLSHDGGSAGALLSVWIDFNLDGDWDDVNEQVLSDAFVQPGFTTTSLESVVVPADAPSGTTFLRARISTDAGLSPRGEASDGEVEDFALTLGTPPPSVADLSLEKTVDNSNPALDDEITFTVTLRNAGPSRATNIEVTDLLPFELFFEDSDATRGSYDDFDGIWLVDSLDSGESAVLSITATVDSTDPITNTAEVTASDQMDPDSTPDNAVAGEDDQASVSLGSCLTADPLHAGMNRLVYSCSVANSFVAFVRGSERGTTTFSRFGVSVDISDAEDVAIAIADSSGIAEAFFPVTDTELSDTILVQAFEITPPRDKSNTLSLEFDVASLASTTQNLLDVNRDDVVSALDALMVINHLHDAQHHGESVAMVDAERAQFAPNATQSSYLDTNADKRVTALDALLVINHLSRNNDTPASGEAQFPVAALPRHQTRQADLDADKDELLEEILDQMLVTA